jgi:hypothetical protein
MFQDKRNFADNGLFGDIAKFAKIETLMPKSAWKKNIGKKVGAGLVLGATAAIILTVFFPPAGISLGTLIGLGIGTGLIGTGITYLLGTLVNGVGNLLAKHKMNNAIAEIIYETPVDSEEPYELGALISPSLRRLQDANQPSRCEPTSEKLIQSGHGGPMFQPKTTTSQLEEPLIHVTP